MYRTLNYNNYLTFRKAEDIEILKRMHYITLWRTRFGRGYGPVIRQTVE